MGVRKTERKREQLRESEREKQLKTDRKFVIQKSSVALGPTGRLVPSANKKKEKEKVLALPTTSSRPQWHMHGNTA